MTVSRAERLNPLGACAPDGRITGGVEVMLGVDCMLRWYGPSHPAMEDRPYAIGPMRCFADIGPAEVADPTTI